MGPAVGHGTRHLDHRYRPFRSLIDAIVRHLQLQLQLHRYSHPSSVSLMPEQQRIAVVRMLCS